jgi:hypothetical protein
LFLNTSWQNNIANGTGSLGSTTIGNNNVGIWVRAGNYIANRTTTLSLVDNSIFIGAYSRALANSQTNQIVIGDECIGNGSNTVTLGNTSIVSTTLRGAIITNELSTDPADPAEWNNVQRQSDGTGSWDDGDIMMKITAWGVTKTTTLVDFSAL